MHPPWLRRRPAEALARNGARYDCGQQDPWRQGWWGMGEGRGSMYHRRWCTGGDACPKGGLYASEQFVAMSCGAHPVTCGSGSMEWRCWRWRRWLWLVW